MNYCQFRNQTIKRMANAGGGGLPSIYQAVEFLESSGTQYISTGVSIQTNYEQIQMKIMALRTGSNYRYFGYYVGNGVASIQGFGDSNGPLSFIHIGPGSFVAASTAINTEYTIDLTANNGTLTGEYCGATINRTYSGSVGTKKIENIFTDQRPTVCCYARIYYYRLYTANGLACDLIPCYRKSDNKPGMYDLVTNTFLTNAGTGEFTVGNDVL